MAWTDDPEKGASNGELQLSPRQLECLRLAAQGLTSPQIAKALGISARTVNQYMGEACERLGVRNRIQAVAKVVALGLVSPCLPGGN